MQIWVKVFCSSAEQRSCSSVSLPMVDITAKEEVPHQGHHPDHGFASASPVTDGKLAVFFYGSGELAAICDLA